MLKFPRFAKACVSIEHPSASPSHLAPKLGVAAMQRPDETNARHGCGELNLHQTMIG